MAAYIPFASIRQQCFSLTPNQHQPPATSQPIVLFFLNKSAPATSHSQPNRVACFLQVEVEKAGQGVEQEGRGDQCFRF